VLFKKSTTTTYDDVVNPCMTACNHNVECENDEEQIVEESDEGAVVVSSSSSSNNGWFEVK